MAGDAPGLDLIVYGGVLVLVIAFAPRGLIGAARRCAQVAARGRVAAFDAGGRAWLSRLLSVERVSRRFGGLLAVNAASLAAPAGRITALIGPNGAGKTTLFAIISGFLKPSEGVVRYDGEDITGVPPLSTWRGAASPAPSRSCSLRRPLGAREHPGRRASAPSARAIALAAAEVVGREVGLGDMLDRPADTLTVAGRKRLELARALATEPKLLLLDEVLAGLEPVRNPRHRAGHPRPVRARHHHHDDRARHAGGDEPVGARVRAGGRPHHRRGQPGRRWRPTPPWSRPISATARRRSSEAAHGH